VSREAYRDSFIRERSVTPRRRTTSRRKAGARAASKDETRKQHLIQYVGCFSLRIIIEIITRNKSAMGKVDLAEALIEGNQVAGDVLALRVLPPPPPRPSFVARVGRFVLMYVVVPTTLLPIGLTILAVKRKLPQWKDVVGVYRVVSDADANPIKRIEGTAPAGADDKGKDGDGNGHGDDGLLSKVYALPSARRYVDRNAFEWQKQEGYCAPATMRCVLKSFGGGGDSGGRKCATVPVHWIPEQKSGGSDPERFCKAIEELPKRTGDAEQQQTIKREENNGITTPPSFRTRTFRPNDADDEKSYEDFLSFIRTGLDDESSRVVVNYLRPALFGFPKPWWVPIHFVLGLFAGHFSPVIGMIEPRDDTTRDGNVVEGNPEEKPSPLIAVFDVNHKYRGAYLVPARRLYQAVKAKDIATQQSRAVIVVSLVN